MALKRTRKTCSVCQSPYWSFCCVFVSMWTWLFLKFISLLLHGEIQQQVSVPKSNICPTWKSTLVSIFFTEKLLNALWFQNVVLAWCFHKCNFFMFDHFEKLFKSCRYSTLSFGFCFVLFCWWFYFLFCWCWVAFSWSSFEIRGRKY